jgi:hypothetical protein
MVDHLTRAYAIESLPIPAIARLPDSGVQLTAAGAEVSVQSTTLALPVKHRS